MFILGGAPVVVLSFFLVMRQDIDDADPGDSAVDRPVAARPRPGWGLGALVVLAVLTRRWG